jgi:hypothetical protein
MEVLSVALCGCCTPTSLSLPSEVGPYTLLIRDWVGQSPFGFFGEEVNILSLLVITT